MRWEFNLLVFGMALAGCQAALAPAYNLGRIPSTEEIRAWDNAAGPAGKELPPGRGTAPEGAVIYRQKCAACHGPTGSEGPRPALVGGEGTLTTPYPLKTIGSFWPFPTTIWDKINRAMPLGQEGTLSADEVYALTALLLYWNNIINENDIMDAKSLPEVQMPNRDGFIPERLEDLHLGHCRLGPCP